MLHAKYISCGPNGCREEDFLKNSHYKSMENLDPRSGASLDPRDLIGRIYVGGHYILLHTKYISFELPGFRDEDV